MNQYIRSVRVSIPEEKKSSYPFCLTAVRDLGELELHGNVSFFIGENGSGKSTILEAIAIAFGFNPEGGSRNFSFQTENTHSELSEHMTITKGIRRPKDGFFLRAESFYNVATNIDELDKDPMSPSILDAYGGMSLHKQSHGESFFSLVMNRFRGRGLYILDEPEAALSPTRQMALLSRIHDLVQEDSQFLIATHSPILMSYPDSNIYDIESAFDEVLLEHTEHFQVTRNFINNKKSMLDILLGD